MGPTKTLLFSSSPLSAPSQQSPAAPQTPPAAPAAPQPSCRRLWVPPSCCPEAPPTPAAAAARSHGYDQLLQVTKPTNVERQFHGKGEREGELRHRGNGGQGCAWHCAQRDVTKVQRL